MTAPGVGTNRYAYSHNDPVNLSDPGGNNPVGFATRLAVAVFDFFFGTVEGAAVVTSGAVVASLPNDPPSFPRDHNHGGEQRLPEDDPDPEDPDPNDQSALVAASIVAAAGISTAKPEDGQSASARSFEEKLLIEAVIANPQIGRPLPNLNRDPRFSRELGWQKMQYSHKTGDGHKITIHYQVNMSAPNQAYDIKIVTNTRFR